MAGYTEVIAEFRPKNNADFPILDLRYISNGTDEETGKPVMLAETIQQVKEIAQQGDNTAILNTQRTQGDAIESLKTKTTNISYIAGTSTTTIGGKVTFAGETHEDGVYDEKVKHILSLVKDASGKVLEYTTIDGDKFFTGDVHAPNIDDMLGDMRSFLTVSLSKTTIDLQNKLNSAVASMNGVLPRVGANENAIATLQDKTAAITKNGTKTTISGVFELAGKSVEVFTLGNGEFVDVVRDASGNILEYTTIDGDKFFTGDVHAPNIDDMLGDMRSFLTTSLNKTTDSLIRRMDTAEANIGAITLKTNQFTEMGTTEFAHVLKDASGGILEYTDVQGDKYFTGDIHAPNIDAMFEKLDAEMAVAMSKTSSTLSSKVATLETKVGRLDSLYEGFQLLTNTEYSSVLTDSLGKIISYTTLDGETHFNCDIHAPNIDDVLTKLDTEIAKATKQATSNVASRVASLESSVSRLALVAETVSVETNSEYVELVKDSMNKVIEYTDTDGDKHFVGNVYSPNIDRMREELDTLLYAYNHS